MKLLRKDPLTLTHDDIDAFDIGTRLSRLNRYAGAGRFAYSVAQHSVLLSLHVPVHLRFAAVTHDIPEVWIGEIPAPFKDTVPEIAVREDAIMRHFASLYDEPWEHYEELVAFDKAIRASEVWALFGVQEYDPMQVPVEEMWPERAALHWCARFRALAPQGGFADV